MSPAVVLSPFSQMGNIFTICSSTGKFLLNFLNVIITVNLLSSFTSHTYYCDLPTKATPSHPVQRDTRTKGDGPLNTSDHHVYTSTPLVPPDTLFYNPMCFLYTLYIISCLLCFYVLCSLCFLYTLYIYSTCNTIQA
jgi:hypothetical protein